MPFILSVAWLVSNRCIDVSDEQFSNVKLKFVTLLVLYSGTDVIDEQFLKVPFMFVTFCVSISGPVSNKEHPLNALYKF